MATTIKVATSTRDRVNKLGARTRQTADQVVSRALEEYERALFWTEFAAAADAVADDPEVATAEAVEAGLWDAVTARDTVRRA
ncbi:MAG: hypothetical protein QM733_05050 [Ilumatobacteraceae bacterium]